MSNSQPISHLRRLFSILFCPLVQWRFMISTQTRADKTAIIFSFSLCGFLNWEERSWFLSLELEYISREPRRAARRRLLCSSPFLMGRDTRNSIISICEWGKRVLHWTQTHPVPRIGPHIGYFAGERVLRSRISPNQIFELRVRLYLPGWRVEQESNVCNAHDRHRHFRIELDALYLALTMKIWISVGPNWWKFSCKCEIYCWIIKLISELFEIRRALHGAEKNLEYFIGTKTFKIFFIALWRDYT